jgi:hypothetical protein
MVQLLVRKRCTNQLPRQRDLFYHNIIYETRHHSDATKFDNHSANKGNERAVKNCRSVKTPYHG